MRDLLIKTDCRSNRLPSTVVAPKNSKPGNYNDAAIQIRLIKNIPDNISDSAVCKLFQDTADLTFIGGNDRFEFDYSELGVGKIIHSAASILGRKGGLVKSERKAASSRKNGLKGGRPVKEKHE